MQNKEIISKTSMHKLQLTYQQNKIESSYQSPSQSIIIIYITNHNCDTISNHEIPGHSKLPTYYDFIFYYITGLILLLVFISILVLQDIPIIKIRKSIYKDCYSIKKIDFLFCSIGDDNFLQIYFLCIVKNVYCILFSNYKILSNHRVII